MENSFNLSSSKNVLIIRNMPLISDGWVGTFVSIYWECHHPNWLLRGVEATNQVWLDLFKGFWKNNKLGSKTCSGEKWKILPPDIGIWRWNLWLNLWKISHKALKNRWIGHSVGISWFNGAFFSVHYIPPSPMVWQYHKPTMTDLGCCRWPVGLAVWNMAGLWLSIQFGMSTSQMTNSIIFQRGR